MTSEKPWRPRHYNDDDLPPYAPRSAPDVAVEAKPVVAETPAEPVTQNPSPVQRQAQVDAAEEAAAYAEARDQGVLPAADPESAILTEQRTGLLEPATVAIRAAVGVGLHSTGAPANSATDGDSANSIPAVEEGTSAAERRGAAREAARQSRRQRAADRLAASRHRRWRDEPIRTLISGLGQTLITLGVVLLLFVVYEVYVTDLFGSQKQAAAKESMEQRWATVSTPPISSPQSSSADTSVPSTVPPVAQEVTNPVDRTRKYTTVIGQGFANIYIPAFGADYSYTVVEGTTTEDLYGNPGHYDDTQYPGELGNFAVAGHRVSKGSPFNALGTLNSCDAIVIETKDDWFVYRVLPMAAEKASWNPASRPECAEVAPLTGDYTDLTGRVITDPTDYAQVLPVPEVDATGPAAVAAATQRIITLTTCHPQFSDRQRMIIHGVLTKSYAKADGFLPPELNES